MIFFLLFKVDANYADGKYEEAKSNSNLAIRTAIAAIVIGLILTAVLVALVAYNLSRHHY